MTEKGEEEKISVVRRLLPIQQGERKLHNTNRHGLTLDPIRLDQLWSRLQSLSNPEGDFILDTDTNKGFKVGYTEMAEKGRKRPPQTFTPNFPAEQLLLLPAGHDLTKLPF